MSFTPDYTGAFKKDYKLIISRGYDISLLEKVIKTLLEKGELPKEYKPHPLISNYKGFMECHIKNNWLLIWKINPSEKTIIFTRTGTHSDLF
jgi:mRNA interferase YafQ